MNFKKVKTIFLVSLVLFIFKVDAQNKLEPLNQSVFDDNNERFNYFSNVRKALFEDIHPEYVPLARYIVMPSFKPEYVLTFDGGYKEYNLIYTSVKKHNIWDIMDEPDKKSEVYKIKKEIDSTDSKLVVSLINNFIKKSKFQNRYGYDGTNYFFSNSEQTATIWSPKTKSKTYYLIEIMNEIIELVKSDEEKIKFSPELVKRIKKLNPN